MSLTQCLSTKRLSIELSPTPGWPREAATRGEDPGTRVSARTARHDQQKRRRMDGVAGEIERVGVLGGGQMGGGIAEVCARVGLQVTIRDVDAEAVASLESRITISLDRALQNEKVTEVERDETLARIVATTDIDALSASHILIEAIVEDEDAKVEAFSALDALVEDEHAILATNTSSIPIMKLAMATNRPESVLGLHFFNPVPVMRLVELVPSLHTSEECTSRCEAFAVDRLGKHVIRSKDRAGFVVNALLIPYILLAIRMFESGFVTPEDIDAGMVLGCAHPMGPLALADLIGLDTLNAVAESLYREFREPQYAPPPLLSRMVEAGLLGKKVGRGFYAYHERS